MRIVPIDRSLWRLNLQDGVTTLIAPMLRFPEAIEHILRTDPRKVVALIDRGREHVVREFSWRVIADRFAAALGSLCFTARPREDSADPVAAQ